MNSIMQKKDGRCFLCETLGDFRPKQVEEHHCIFGTSGRKLSTKFGLTVFLCADHHRNSKLSVHQDHELAAYLQDRAQVYFENFYPGEDFMKIFGRNYKLSKEERENALKKLRGGEFL